MTKNKILKIFEIFKSLNPKPTTELIYHTPFELLVAVLLSAQATDRSVNIATEKLFQIANTPKKIINLGEEGLYPFINRINYYRTKAKNLVAACKILEREHAGQVPHSREALESLPGVGRKTANVILNTAFGLPVIAVDTHIFRVSNRIGLVSGKTVRAVEDQLMTIVPKDYLHDAHHWLILHGRYICKAAKPLCPQCPINKYCEYPNKTE